MAPVLDGFDWTGLARVLLICAGVVIIGVRLIDRLFPSQQRGPPHPPADETQLKQPARQSGEGGAAPNRNRLTPRPSEVAIPLETRSSEPGSVVQRRTIEGGTNMATQASDARAGTEAYSLWRVILASSSGTLVAWDS